MPGLTAYDGLTLADIRKRSARCAHARKMAMFRPAIEDYDVQCLDCPAWLVQDAGGAWHAKEAGY